MEVDRLREELTKARAATATLEGDIRLLYQQHRSDLKELDAKYNRKDYKERYKIALAAKAAAEKKAAMALDALEQMPGMSASAHILAGLLNAGVEVLAFFHYINLIFLGYCYSATRGYPPQGGSRSA